MSEALKTFEKEAVDVVKKKRLKEFNRGRKRTLFEMEKTTFLSLGLGPLG